MAASQMVQFINFYWILVSKWRIRFGIDLEQKYALKLMNKAYSFFRK